jgi:formylglycine-generating enzyme required for sulfatase activity
MYPDGMSSYDTLDMMGNVWEWCNDWFAENVYKERTGQDVKDPMGPSSGTTRVLRGGSWVCDRRDVRCAVRYGDDPDGFGHGIGFRVVLSPDIGT